MTALGPLGRNSSREMLSLALCHGPKHSGFRTTSHSSPGYNVLRFSDVWYQRILFGRRFAKNACTWRGLVVTNTRHTRGLHKAMEQSKKTLKRTSEWTTSKNIICSVCQQHRLLWRSPKLSPPRSPWTLLLLLQWRGLHHQSLWATLPVQWKMTPDKRHPHFLLLPSSPVSDQSALQSLAVHRSRTSDNEFKQLQDTHHTRRRVSKRQPGAWILQASAVSMVILHDEGVKMWKDERSNGFFSETTRQFYFFANIFAIKTQANMKRKDQVDQYVGFLFMQERLKTTTCVKSCVNSKRLHHNHGPRAENGPRAVKTR